ncbi:unnamed protein product [Choristocarpus tenellus]
MDGVVPSQLEGRAVDKNALDVLFRSTGGTSWYRKDGWESDSPDLGARDGVVVNSEGRVVELNLSFNNLKGKCTS